MKFFRHFIILKQYITKNGEAIRLASSVNVIIFTGISIFFLLFYFPVSKAISHNVSLLELVAVYGKFFFHNRPSEVMKSK